MKELWLTHSTRGTHAILLDDEDYDFIVKNHIQVRLKYEKTIKNFYAYVGSEPLHRQITNCPKGLTVDHINRNPLDDRKSNLRICTLKENNHNRKVRCNNKWGIDGIHFYTKANRFVIRKTINDKIMYFGRAKTLEEAKEKLARGLANAMQIQTTTSSKRVS